MKIDNSLIEYLEELSRLSLTPEEKESAKNDLTEIINYMDKLNELDLHYVEPESEKDIMILAADNPFENSITDIPNAESINRRRTDTANASTLFSASEEENVFELRYDSGGFREDVITKSFDRAQLLSNASVKNDKYFIVPKTVES